MIRTVIFDIDDTMYDYTEGNLAALKAVEDYFLKEMGIYGDIFCRIHKEASRMIRQRLGNDSAVNHNRLLRYQGMLEILNRPVFPHAQKMSRIYWQTLFEMISPQPGLLDFLSDLKAHGISIGIGTNMTACLQYEKLARLQVDSYIDWIVTSEESGTEKPNPEFYRYCQQKADCPADECLFIGDSLNGDVKAPIAAGMHAIWYDSKNSNHITEQWDGSVIHSFTDCMSDEFWLSLICDRNNSLG